MSAIARVGGLSVSALLATLFAVDPAIDSQGKLDSSFDPATPISGKPDFPGFAPPAFQNLFGDFNPFFNFRPLVQEPDNEYAVAFRKENGFGGREAYLKNLLQTLNPQLLPTESGAKEETALSVFNARHNLSLVCMGIKNKPAEFVFVDKNYFTGQSQMPIRVAFTPDEVTNIKSRGEVIAALEQKLAKHMDDMLSQHTVWAKPYKYDFPKNDTACMFALSLEGLSGMETDLVSSLNMYKKLYGMSVEAMCIDEIHKDTLSGLLKEQNYEGLPQMVPATKKEILNQLEISLKKAVNDKKSAFLFHYLTHGSSDGRIWASDGSFTPEEIAEVISRPYNKLPLCAQIDITIWAGSCYSGKQLDGIKKYLQDRKEIPVKNLRIITESLYTTAGAGTTPQNASLVSDLMTDKSGPLDYYRSWYREYLKYLESQGVEIKKSAGTYLHEVRFADLMSFFDTSNKQDSQGFHYSNDPGTGKITEQYFTQLKISENEGGNQYAMLQNPEVHGESSRNKSLDNHSVV